MLFAFKSLMPAPEAEASLVYRVTDRVLKNPKKGGGRGKKKGKEGKRDRKDRNEGWRTPEVSFSKPTGTLKDWG